MRLKLRLDALAVLLLELQLLLTPLQHVFAAQDDTPGPFYEELQSNHISLKAAVLTAAPPLAVRDETTGEFSGFQIDLLERIQQFAAQDGITLTINLEEGPLYGYTHLLNQIMNDCNTTTNPMPAEECYQYDILIGDYYTNEDRAMKVDFTPPWLQTSVSALKKSTSSASSAEAAMDDVTTLEEADRARATICALVVHDDGLLDVMARAKYPNAKYLECPSMDQCLQELKAGNCTLFINDELKLRHMSVLDPTLEVTRERANSQFITWPLRSNLPPMVLKLMKRWIYAAKSNATLDELFDTYFAASLCPVGKAGLNCELPCDPSHGRSDRTGVCVCDSTKWVGEDCSTEVLENTNSISRPLLVIGYVMVALNVTVVMVCGGWLWLNRASAQVQVAQPFFLCLVLLGCVISTSTIVVFAQDSESEVVKGEDDSFFSVNTACMAIPWLYSVGFSITFGTLFAKIRSVYKMFQSALELRPVRTSVKETVLIIGAVLAVDVAVLTVWTLVDPLKWERTVVTQDKFGEPLSSEGVCISDHWMLFATLIGCLHFCLLGFACYYCWLTRAIPTKFSEGKYVTIAMVSNLQIFVVAVPVLVVLGSDPQASFFVRSVVIWMNDFVVVTLIFGNLMFSVWKDRRDNINGIESIRSAMDKFTSRNLRSSLKSGGSASDLSTLAPGGRNKACLSQVSSQLDDIMEVDILESSEVKEVEPEVEGSRQELVDEGIPSGKKLMEDLIDSHANAIKLSKPQRTEEEEDFETDQVSSSSSFKRSDCSNKLSFTSVLAAMSSLTLSEIDEEMPFDSALRYSERHYSAKGDDIPDKPPLFPRRRSCSDDSEEDAHSPESRQDEAPSAPVRVTSEMQLDFSENGSSGHFPEPIAEVSDEDGASDSCSTVDDEAPFSQSSIPTALSPYCGRRKRPSFAACSDVTDSSPHMPRRWESDLETADTMILQDLSTSNNSLNEQL